MFSKQRKQPSIQLSKLRSLIAEDVVITGDLNFSGGLRIDGRVLGNVTMRQGEAGDGALLVLSDNGRIEGSVRCADAVINGEISGDLEVENFLELQSNCRVSGTIRYRHLKIEVGATVHGQLAKVEAAPALGNVVELAAADKLALTQRN
jgi:cytoskeletal protein CcmA (bactofilin family)